MSNSAKYFVFMLVLGVWKIDVDIGVQGVFKDIIYCGVVVALLIMFCSWCKEKK